MNDPMNRLTADDDLFLKLHHLYPNLINTQIGWVFEKPFPKEFWQTFTDHLANGFGGRRVRKTRIPFARPWFDRTLVEFEVQEETEPVPADQYLDWMWRKGDIKVDPYTGMVGGVSIAPTEDGGQIVIFTASHIVADGGAGLVALHDAISRQNAGLRVSWKDSSGKLVGTTPDRGAWKGHLADARHQLKAAATGIRKAYQARNVAEPPRNPRPADVRLDIPGDWTPSVCIVDVPMADVKRIAGEHGGTPNGLVIALTTGLLGRSGRATEGQKVRVEVPHALRTGLDDPRANATTALPIQVTYRSGGKVDLKEIRSEMRRAGLAYKDSSTIPPIQHLQPIAMMIPQFLVPYMARAAKSPEALVSNIGPIMQTIDTIGGQKATKIVGRPRLGAGPADRFRDAEAGLNIICMNDSETMTMTINGCDPDRYPTRESLQKMIVDEFNEWGLTPTFWGC
ncbi:hypothetical protein [Nocardia stercoris]|uniref:Diacylglycerol O-acyltransferase n=1 Tax=Nocardia stercoris TaxID=2483361 RepID=A0A3M2LDU9_9NOCA|nr:hypothetical protein [Nocardia stercoris]RMI35206.1 hypothetical protein EBN03_02615 [Nocardia stercoris]